MILHFRSSTVLRWQMYITLIFYPHRNLQWVSSFTCAFYGPIFLAYTIAQVEWARGSSRCKWCSVLFSQLYLQHKNWAYWSEVQYMVGRQLQNINHCVIWFIQDLIRRKIYTRVDLKFLVAGHTYGSTDRCFGVIEKYLDKIENVYIPEDWYKHVHQP